jgi:hypothetical protein
LNRHARVNEAQDFKSCVSTSFTTGACALESGFEFRDFEKLCHAFSYYFIPHFLLTAGLVTPMINHVVTTSENIRTFNIFRAIKIAFLPIFLALLAAGNLDQYINTKIEAILRSPFGLSQTIWLYGFASIFSSLLFPLIVAFFASYALSLSIQDENYAQFKARSFREFFSEHFELSFLETLRSWGKTFLWTFLFIIPGLVKFFLYMPVPFVVFFSKRYQNGEVDALKLSQKIARKYWFWFLIYMLAFMFVLPMSLLCFKADFKIHKRLRS